MSICKLIMMLLSSHAFIFLVNYEKTLTLHIARPF